MAALASLSATVHRNAPSFIPTPSRILRALSPKDSIREIPDAFQGLAATLELEPIHLDHVGIAICETIESKTISGAIPVEKLRELALAKSHKLQ